jgi:hypothetical protein
MTASPRRNARSDAVEAIKLTVELPTISAATRAPGADQGRPPSVIRPRADVAA